VSKQQRLLRDMAAQQQLETARHSLLEHSQNQAYRHNCMSYMRILGLLAIIGCGGLYYLWLFHPASLWDTRVKLVDRQLMTVYAPEINLRRDLPRFHGPYTIATAQNAPARAAVKKVAAARRIVTDADVYPQSIQLHAWEHSDFVRQLSTDTAKDRYCQAGFAVQYQRYTAAMEDAELVVVADAAARRDDLLYWCLLLSGQQDGFVRRNVTVEASLTRGMQGVAATYTMDNTPRVRPSFLLLPIRFPKKDAADVTWSTRMPLHIMQWLLSTGGQFESREEYQAAYETFLYRVVQLENTDGRWFLLTAACTSSERTALDATQRRLTTECPAVNMTYNISENETNVTCCSIYDPKLLPYRKNRHNVHEDDAARRLRLKRRREANNQSQTVDESNIRH